MKNVTYYEYEISKSNDEGQHKRICKAERQSTFRFCRYPLAGQFVCEVELRVQNYQNDKQKKEQNTETETD